MVRTQGSRPTRGHVVGVAYDGRNTEADYFNGWQIMVGRGRFILVPFLVGSGGNALKAVREAYRAARRDGDIDELWCVCDADDTSTADLAAAAAWAEAHNVRLCLSTRSFEVWVALHFERCAAPILTESDAIDMVERHLPTYGKSGKIADFNTLFPLTAVAIENAYWLKDQGVSNPSTDVFKLVERLQQLVRRQRARD